MCSALLHKLCNITIVTMFVLLSNKIYGDDLYQFQKKTYTDNKLSPALMQQLYEAKLSYYQEVDRVISEHLFENKIKSEAEKTKKTVEALRSEIFNPGEINEKEIKKF